MNIIAITPDRDNYISPIEKYLNYPLIFQRELNWERFIKKKPLAAIFLADWKYDLANFIIKCKENRIPTILMMDGTIEWKHFFENPKWSFGGNESPYFPVYCDKVFVPGASTYRFLKNVGVNNNCEITGLPRLDRLLIKNKNKNNHNKKVIGVMSGNTAGYDDGQIKNSIRLFEDLNSYFLNQSEYKVKWRLRKNFEDNLSFKITPSKNESLDEFLNTVDGVISQPSTVVYESMILGKNVAIADYSISPNYMQSAWEIKSKNHIDDVIKELIKPSEIKLKLQKYYLDDTIANIFCSSEVIGKLINEIIDHVKTLPKSKWFLPEKMFKDLQRDSKEIIHPIYTEPYNDRKKLEELLIKSQVKINELNQEILNRSIFYNLRKFFFKILNR